MKYIIVILIMNIIANAKIISKSSQWEVGENEQTAECYIRYDTETYNISYSCNNVELHSINILDVNGFRVAYTYGGGYSGYGETRKPTNTPYSISATGKVDNICLIGYTKRNGICVDNNIIEQQVKIKYQQDSLRLNEQLNKKQTELQYKKDHELGFFGKLVTITILVFSVYGIACAIGS